MKRGKDFVEKEVKLIGGEAKPGPILSSLNINMQEFCRKFNEETKNNEQKGKVLNVKFDIFNDGRYIFFIKGVSISTLIREEIGEKKEITQEELEKIISKKKNYLNTKDKEKMKKIINGTLKSMGIKLINSS